MAITTGTAILLGAGVGALGKLGGSAIESRASGRATEAGLEFNQQALDEQREQQARAEAAYEEERRAWQADRRLLMQRYGIDIASLPAGPGGPDGPGGAPGGPGAVPRGPGTPVGPGAPMGRPTPGGRPMPGPVRGANLSLGELASGPASSAPRPQLGDWNDWARMGLGRGVRA